MRSRELKHGERFCFAILFGVLAMLSRTPPGHSTPTFLDLSQSLDRRVAYLVSRMTLQQNASHMQKHAVVIPRLNILEYDWWSEGLQDIAGSGYGAVFPQAIGLAAPT